MTQPEYVFHRVEDERELERLRAIEQVCDAATRRRLLVTGVKAGWTCLEVGPGAGSVLGWMSEAVGPMGRVVAVDISTKFLGQQQPRNVEVHQADVRAVPLPEAAFDLVHARYVLIHLPDYQTALSKMLACLKPGGWLVLEEPDFSASRGITGDAGQLASVAKVNQAIKAMYDKLGMDDALGLKLPSSLQHRGMGELTVEYDAPLSSGGSGMATMMKMSAEQLRDKYLATGAVTALDLTQYGRFAEDPQSWAIYYATVAVTGRKPL
ncbi:MAG: class I SAM-dependent methyltransferase [Nitrospirae bacterium]|nr:class I SAM-dependent methyltransferase [Nitrospirota bacterium]